MLTTTAFSPGAVILLATAYSNELLCIGTGIRTLAGSPDEFLTVCQANGGCIVRALCEGPVPYLTGDGNEVFEVRFTQGRCGDSVPEPKRG
jgi:hypothetical protein